MAHVADYKKKIVADFVKLMNDYPIIGVIDMENLPTPQLQQMRAQLRDKMVLRMTKRRLMTLAIDKCNKEGFGKLKEHLKGMPALFFTKEDPFKINKILKKSKSFAPAKPGQIAPNDIKITAGPTPFPPGPIIGELGQAGLKTGVEDNKVVIKEDKIVVKEGEVIEANIASILSRLDIKPMEIGLNLVAVYEKGNIIPKEILTVDEQEYIDNVSLAASWALNLSIEAAYLTKDNTTILIGKAFNDAKTLALEKQIMSDIVAESLMEKAERQALSIKETGNIETQEKKETPKTEEPKKEVKEEPKEEKKEQPKTEKPKEEPIDSKVAEMVKKTKEKMAGKEKKAEDILAEVEQTEKSKEVKEKEEEINKDHVPSAHELAKKGK